MSKVAPEFAHVQTLADPVGEAFTELLEKLTTSNTEAFIPVGRARALMITKLQEACMWSRQAFREVQS